MDADAVALEQRIRFLSQPGSYPEGTATVQVIETHFSIVFLTERHVYKMKRPQRYPFVDLSTLQARHRNCLEEIRINRFLAPRVYLGLATVRCTEDGSLSLSGGGRIVDYLVLMERLDDRLNLEVQLRDGTATISDVDRAAGRLTAYYQGAERMAPCRVDERRVRCRKLARELSTQLGTSPAGDCLCRLLETWLDRNAPLIESRQRVDAHGDLRPQHVYLGPDPVFIDRLEFDARLRRLDPVEELCFLTLECDRYGARWVGERFLDRFAEGTGSARMPALERYYEASRALLWAVLAARHLATASGDASHWIRRANDYLHRGLDRMAAADSDT